MKPAIQPILVQVAMLLALAALTVGTAFAQSRATDWERIVEEAKKEGKDRKSVV